MANAALVQKRVYVSSAEVVWESTTAEEFLLQSDFNERAMSTTHEFFEVRVSRVNTAAHFLVVRYAC